MPTARHIGGEVETAFARFKARGRGENGDLVLDICMALSIGNLRATLANYGVRHEEVRVHSIDGPHSRLMADFASGVIDVLLMAGGYATWTDRFLPLWSERVVVALLKRHRLTSLLINRLDNVIECLLLGHGGHIDLWAQLKKSGHIDSVEERGGD